MKLTRSTLVTIATAGSGALLLGALGFQLAGYAPCKMCLWQRWPHALALVIGAAYFATKSRLLCWLGALAAASTSAIGAFHAGVEQKWWEGPTSCTGAGDALSGLAGSDLLPGSATSGIVMCDAIVWDLFGVTMAGWNFLFAGALAVIWVLAALRKA
ncbi:Disulfide bond formation protein B [Aquimixticola soesokkakensis]|uniref:Disulfide bond formation protein B n=1 Tax=Aquimixticola soesokkakensis TaxID=1519096 RepID=A0A1Y5SGP5_9RHOB|nr:disulfide bond formation protein B [Aquimixticola soesokkakensis]SLN40289.1 Disulfide bond formation protein B [Aquimixticola soesokkakensis]